MKENNEGFLYPFINKKKCKNCGLCLKKCVSCNKDTNNSQKVKNCLMVISNSPDVAWWELLFIVTTNVGGSKFIIGSCSTNALV